MTMDGLLRLDGRLALVTGAASGIGRATALLLAQAGAAVLASDLDAAALADLERPGLTVMTQDVAEEAGWQAVAARLAALPGRFSILVNNAGIGIGGPVETMTLAAWRRQTAVNLDGVFLGTRMAIPLMRAAGSGVIVTLSSVAGLRGAAGLAGYSATKGAVRLFSRSVAVELARRGDPIRCVSIHPGIIDTPIWTHVDDEGRQAISGGGANAQGRVDPAELARRAVPGGRMGSPEEVARVILFAVSDAATYVNGAELVVDGALTA